MKIKPENAPEEFKDAVGKAKPDLECMLNYLKQKVAYIFTNESIAELKPKIEENKIATLPKAGTFALKDVNLQPGPTGMDPS